MVVPLLLLIASLIGTAFAVTQPEYGDYLLLAGPSAIASLILFVRAIRGGGQRGTRWILVDGSNVLYWKDNTPQIQTVREVLKELKRQKLVPCVVFDANVGYLIGDRYLHDAAMAHKLGMRKDRVMVVPKGTPADEFILTAARDFTCCIVSNDRYRDWAAPFPEVYQPGRLICGGYEEGKLWLSDIDPIAATRPFHSAA